MSNYRTYGEQHGTACFWDKSKPDTDAFLAYMEARLPKHGVEDYMEGFMDGILGECRWEHTQFAGLAKKGSNKENNNAR